MIKIKKINEIRGCDSLTWLSQIGWSLSLWLFIEKPEIIYKGEQCDGRLLIFAQENTENSHCISISLSDDYTLLIASILNVNVPFPSIKFKENVWYHLMITQSRSSSESLMNVYLNGIFKESKYLQYPIFSSKQSQAISLHLGSEKEKHIEWRLGNMFFFDVVACDEEVTLIYLLGPSYSGSFRFTSFYFPDVINSDALEQYKDYNFLLNPGEKFSLKKFQNHAKLSFYSRDTRFFALVEKNLVKKTAKNVQSSNSVRLEFQQLGTQEIHQINFKNALYAIGGVEIIIYLLGMAKENQIEIAQHLFKILSSLLRYNFDQMHTCKGYNLVAGILRVNRSWLSNPTIMEILFESAGLYKKKDSKDTIFSDGCISNKYVLQNWLFNWSIWMNSPTQFQMILIKTFEELLTTHRHATYHVHIFNDIQGLQSFLDLFLIYNTLPPHQTISSITKCINALVQPKDINKLHEFIVTTHSKEIPVRRCESHSKINLMKKLNFPQKDASIEKIRKNIFKLLHSKLFFLRY